MDEKLGDIFLKFNSYENNENLEYCRRSTKPILIETCEPVYLCTFRKVVRNCLCVNIYFRVSGILLLEGIKFFNVWCRGTITDTVSIKVMTTLTIWLQSTKDSKIFFTSVTDMNSYDEELSFKIAFIAGIIQLSLQSPVRCRNRFKGINSRKEKKIT